MPKAHSDINDILQKAFQDSESELDLKSLLNNKMKEYDLTKTKVRNLLNIEFQTFEDIINGIAKQPSLINVIKIAQFLEIDTNDAVAAILKNADKEYIGSIVKAKRVSFIAKNFDIKKLHKIGFFTQTDDANYLVNRVLSFFGYLDIIEFENNLTIPLFSKSKRNFADKMKDFWVKAAYQCFKEINNPFEYDREGLKELIGNMKPYCQDMERGLFTVCKALYNVGVTVIFQRQLTTTQVRGGTFIVNGKPCIVLTDLNKRYTTIWHVLIHELHHVLYDIETISNTTSFHLSGDPDLFLIEDKADDFASEFFCGYDRYSYAKRIINSPFLVKKFASDIEVHESFVYMSFIHFQEKLHGQKYYGAYSKFIPDCSIAVKNLNLITWKEDSLSEIAKKIKSFFESNLQHEQK